MGMILLLCDNTSIVMTFQENLFFQTFTTTYCRVFFFNKILHKFEFLVVFNHILSTKSLFTCGSNQPISPVTLPP